MPVKPILYLAPGLLCDIRLWAHQAHGLSDLVDIRIPDMTIDSNLPAMAKRMLAHAPDQFLIAGLSMGGYLAMEVMRQAPDRVSHLALLDTTWRADGSEALERRKKLIAFAEGGKFSDVMGILLPMLVHPDRRDDRNLIGIIKDMANAIGPDAFIHQQTAIMGRPDSWDLLGQIKVPGNILVLCGADDALTDLETHKKMAAEIPHARLEIIAECGHLSALEQPDAVTNALQNWLQPTDGA